MMPRPEIDVRIVDHPVSGFEGFGSSATESGDGPGVGGECLFLGRTRCDVHPRHGALARLSYHAYRPLAERTLLALADEACSRFGCSAVRIVHAVGEVPPGEVSVLVQVRCGHRGEAFDACRFLIDSLKRSAPIWKQEQWTSGERTWARGETVEAP